MCFRGFMCKTCGILSINYSAMCSIKESDVVKTLKKFSPFYFSKTRRYGEEYEKSLNNKVLNQVLFKNKKNIKTVYKGTAIKSYSQLIE